MAHIHKTDFKLDWTGKKNALVATKHLKSFVNSGQNLFSFVSLFKVFLFVCYLIDEQQKTPKKSTETLKTGN